MQTETSPGIVPSYFFFHLPMERCSKRDTMKRLNENDFFKKFSLNFGDLNNAGGLKNAGDLNTAGKIEQIRLVCKKRVINRLK